MTSTFPDLAALAWVLLAAAALLVGVSKTALPGINTLSIAVFAAVLPARASTGALLLLLIVGDMFALLAYRRHADWATLVRLIPAVVAGLLLGAVFLAVASDGWVRRAIGVILLLVIAATLWQRWRGAAASRATARAQAAGAAGAAADADRTVAGAGRAAGAAGAAADGDRTEAAATGDGSARGSSIVRAGYGSLGGFTTMVANAGGPVMSMYFLAARFPVKAFLGTAAWFFAVINLAKLPVSIGLGLITPATLWIDLLLLPGVIAGAFLGRWIASRIQQRAFDWAVIACTTLGAVYLLL